MDILMLNTELPSRKKREITEEVCGCHGGGHAEGWCGCLGQGEMEADDSLVFSKVQ